MALNVVFLDHPNLTEYLNMSLGLERKYSFSRSVLSDDFFFLVLIEFEFQILLNSGPILPNFLVSIHWRQ